MPADLQILALRIAHAATGDNKIAMIRDLRIADGAGRHLSEYKAAVEGALNRPSAASLPFGTIVAGADATFMKHAEPAVPGMPWSGGPDLRFVNDYTDDEIDDMLQRGEAQVLRIGEGAS